LGNFSGVLQIKLSGEDWTAKVYFGECKACKKRLKAR